MQNLFRLLVPLIINPYYYIRKFKRNLVNNFFEYEKSPYNRLSLIYLVISQTILKKDYENFYYKQLPSVNVKSTLGFIRF